MLDAGEIDCNSGVGIKEITGLATVLEANTLYWLVILTNDSSWQTTYDSTLSIPNIIGWTTATLDTNGVTYVRAAQAYGALPATYPVVGYYYEKLASPRIGIYW